MRTINCGVFFMVLAIWLTVSPYCGAKEIELISARYGTVDAWKDVSTLLRDKLSMTSSDELPINSETFGDPARNRNKQLELKIRINGQEKHFNGARGNLPLNPARWDEPGFRVSEIQRQIEDAYRRGDKKIVLSPGVYKIPLRLNQTHHLTFWFMKDFEIDATGVTFLFESRKKSAIRFDQCSNVVFKGATFLREEPSFTQGTIINRSNNYLDVEIHRGYPDQLDSSNIKLLPMLNIFGKDRRIKHGFDAEAYYSKIEKLKDGVFRFHLTDFMTTAKVGDLVATRRTDHPFSAEFEVVDCTGMNIDGVTIKNAITISLKESYAHGEGNRYSYNVTYGPPPKGATEKPLISGAADAFYSESSRKGPTLENCRFEGQHDDDVNIHGKIWRVRKIDGKKAEIDFVIALPLIGDVFCFYDDQHALAGKRKLIAREWLANGRLSLTFEQDVPADSRTTVNENTSGSGFVIRNVVGRNHRGRGFLIRGNNGLIENCLLEDIQNSGISVVPEFLWANEGPYTENLIIRNNIIRRCAMNCWGPTAALGVGNLSSVNFEKASRGPYKFSGLPGGHRNVLIEGNRIEDCLGPNLSITSTIGATVKDNIFISPMRIPYRYNRHDGLLFSNALITVAGSSGVVFSGNRIVNPGSLMKQIVRYADDVPDPQKNDGFIVKKEGLQ
ncbi:MAG: right-handed parallel beta-helix repeat-containing protein [Victivallales bacterium]|jgi:hypothetical protein|nr:right-handed parallel beta-helix repeat-containing protein [Victivallales bacterium]